MTEDLVRDIDDIAPDTTSGDGEYESRPFTKKPDLIGVPLRLTDYRGPFNGSKGPFTVFDATRLDTGEEVSFTGATVLNQKGEVIKSKDAFPVEAQLVKDRSKKGNDYWNFRSPEKS